MKKIFLFPILALFLMCACEPKPIVPEEPDRPQTPEELILGSWFNTSNSYLSISDATDSETMSYDPHSFLFTFKEDGSLRMDYFDTELTIPGVENTTYQLRNDSLILGDGMTYIVTHLSDSLLVLEYSETMGDGEMTYREHLEMQREVLDSTKNR